MNSSSIFPFSAKFFAELKVHWVKSSQQWLFKVSLCCLGLMCLAFQVQAQTQAPAPANTNPPATTTAAAATGVSAPSGAVDMSKVPPVTAPSRPGLFLLPPTPVISVKNRRLRLMRHLHC